MGFSHGEGRATDGHRLAVLPLNNISPDRSDEYFADGLTEELISVLSRVSGLRVIARTSAMRFKGSSKGAKEIGEELGVRSLLEGSVRMSENRLRVSVQLIDAASEEPLWSSTYERPLTDIFEIQRDIARRVARALKVRFPRHEPKVAPPEGASLDAYTLFLRARSAAAAKTTAHLHDAIGLYEKSIAADPRLSPALAGLSEAYAALALIESIAPSDAFPKARAFAEQALAIDPRSAEAHSALGLVEFQYDWNWNGAESELRRAIELNPNLPQAHQYLADYLKAMGRFDEAVEEMHRALDLDPLSLAIHTGLGHVLYLRRDFDAAIAQYRKALAMDPSFVNAHLWFGRPFLEKRMFGEAIAEVSTAVDLSGGSTISLAVLAHAYASSGRSAEARTILERLLDRARTSYLPSYWIALVYTGLGEDGQALHWLDRAYSDRSSWLVWIAVEPRFDRLRPLREFASLTGRMGLPAVTPPSGAGSVPASEEALSLLSGSTELRVGRYVVVGDYVRFDEATRQRLKDLDRGIRGALQGTSARRDTFLLWSPPGGGKTYLIRESARAAGPLARYVELNLAAMSEGEFDRALTDSEVSPQPLLVLVDEVDSQADALWPYERLLPFLDRGVSGRRPVVVVLAGSSRSSIEEFAEAIRRRSKGSDLLSRVPEENRFALPPTTAGDRVLVAAASLRSLSEAAGKRVNEVEKLALYYLATHPDLESPRQLREAVIRCVERIPAQDDRVRFDHLFPAGDRKNKEFWVRARKETPGLIDSFVRLEG